MNPRHVRPASAGFTLIELLVVIGIIGIVVAIVFPALAGARNAARKAATQALLGDIGKACEQFEIDHQRKPGYYSPRHMGLNENQNRGFTAMENLMLDLAGGLAPNASNSSGPNSTIVQVGPTGGTGSDPDDMVKVDIGLIGAKSQQSRLYYSPDPRYYTNGGEGGNGQVGVDDHRKLPDIVDAWGTPVLAWVQDDIAAGQGVRFAEVAYAPNAVAMRARYYWASNAGFLKSTRLGRMGHSQVRGTDKFSLLSEVASMPVLPTMAGLLGNPAYPEPNAPDTPAQGRAPIVFHSAGPDGIYLSSRDVGGKRAMAGSPAGRVQYNPPVPAATAGQPVGKAPDPLEGFDDLVITAGNN